MMKFILETDSALDEAQIKVLADKFLNRVRESDVAILTHGLKLAAVMQLEETIWRVDLRKGGK